MILVLPWTFGKFFDVLDHGSVIVVTTSYDNGMVLPQEIVVVDTPEGPTPNSGGVAQLVKQNFWLH